MLGPLDPCIYHASFDTPLLFRSKVVTKSEGPNDITAALFLVSLSQLPAAKKQGSCDVIKALLIS